MRLACHRHRIQTILVPTANGPEAAAVGGLRVLAASTLREAVAMLNGDAVSPPSTSMPPATTSTVSAS